GPQCSYPAGAVRQPRRPWAAASAAVHSGQRPAQPAGVSPMSLPSYRPIPPCPRGAALLVRLVMLLLLPVIALAAASDSALHQRMPHTSRQLNKSFQAAESALRHLEQQLEAGFLPLPTDPCQPLCEVPVTVLNGAAGSAPGADW